MTDQELVQAGYEAAIKNVYAIYHAEVGVAKTPAETKAAEDKFVRLFAAARQFRDRAINLIP